MRFSPPFDNTAPASVTPGRGAAFDNAWWPQAPYQSRLQFEAYFRPAWSPANATASTVNGVTVPASYPNAVVTEWSNGTFASLQNNGTASIYSAVINAQTVFPLLLGSCGGFSVYATSATVAYDSQFFQVNIMGSAFITGPNGYNSIGYFRYNVPQDPEDERPFAQPYDTFELQVYAQEAGLTARQSNTAPAQTFNIKAQLRNGNAFQDSLPETKFSSRLRVFFTSVPSYYPAGANYLTATGFTLPGGSGSGQVQIRSGTFLSAFAPGAAATLQSVILDGQHKFPLLLCTVGEYSFYATNAGGFRGGLQPNGSCLVTGPNGYNVIGTFNYLMQGDANGTSFPGNCELYVYVNETNRLMAQPSNAAPEARQ